MVGTVRFGPIGRASRLPGVILGPWDQAGRAWKDRLGAGIGREGPGTGPEASKRYVLHYFRARSGGCCALETVSSSPSSNSPELLISFDFSRFWPQNLHFPEEFHYSGVSGT